MRNDAFRDKEYLHVKISISILFILFCIDILLTLHLNRLVIKDNYMDDKLNLEQTVLSDYKYGFVTNIEADEAPRGLDESTIRFISAKK